MIRVLAAALVLVLGTTVAAQSVPSGFKVDAQGGPLSDGTALAVAPDGRLFVAQLEGTVRVIKDGALLATPFHTVAVDHPAGTDRGLLGLCLDPGFASNGFVYLYFTNASPAPHNCVRRLQANSPGSDVSDGTEVVIVDLENLGSDTMHNGGGIQFGGDGKLYVAVGDNAVPSFAQSITSRFGKILRYNADGSIPTDNPTTFPGIAGSPVDEFRAIWAVGLRNPFRFAFQPGTMRMMINDVGAASWEEIDSGAAGLNYGWAGGDTDGARGLPDYTDPIFQYGHSGTVPAGRAITGGVFYNPSTLRFPASYAGKYFFADYVAGFIYTLDPAAPGTATPFLQGAAGIVDLQVGPDGALYYLDKSGSPGVYRISHEAPAAAPNPPAGSPAGSTIDPGHKKSCGATGLEPLLLIVLLRRFKRRRDIEGHARGTAPP
jgi:glucose/arabinose dehydrogenase